jgi:Ca2+-binding EF-hand superfamily protein
MAVMSLSALILALSAAAAQAPAAAPIHVPSHPFRRLFVSPMGEPFTGDRGGDALASWFQQADRNRDGSLTKAEMEQDAERFFATLDLNRDGEIDPDEITRYETQIAPTNRRSLGLLALSQPVTAADSNFNRGVTLSEFRAAADKRFGALDLDKRGVLRLERLAEIRPDGPTRQRRDFNAPPRQPSSTDPGRRY